MEKIRKVFGNKKVDKLETRTNLSNPEKVFHGSDTKFQIPIFRVLKIHFSYRPLFFSISLDC